MHFDLDTVNGVKKGIIFTEPDLMKKNIVKYIAFPYTAGNQLIILTAEIK